ncbi:MAG TPA: tetratricopeptide repeat protein [Nitrospiraceae bacterium]|nr:tetratricopeptide repeat protein [Nitrospiraceae bacterium]
MGPFAGIMNLGERKISSSTSGFREFARLRTTLGIFFISLITMDVQDFLVQGEGHEEDKREAWQLFQQAYERQMKGELEEAVTLYKKSIETHPTAEAYTFLGWTYSFMGRLDDAIEECHKAIAQDPDFGNPYNDIGAYLIEKGELDEAITWFQKAFQARRYESPAFPHLNLGRVYERKGQWTEAIDAYKKALALNPNYALAKKALGRLISSLN